MEIIRAAMAALNRGDWDAALSYTAPGFTLDNARDSGESRGVHETSGQVKRMWERIAEL
ncbi:MAG: hypothetical protein ACRENN_08895 [Candidatus Eiseniibacteriota bacterium]